MATPLRVFTHVLASTLDAVMNSLATSRPDRRVRQSLLMNQPVVFEIITPDACRSAAPGGRENRATDSRLAYRRSS